MSYKYIYAISSGEYSDYSVKCVCASKSEATKLCSKLNKDGRDSFSQYRVEKFILCDSSLEKNTTHIVSVELMDDGTEKRLNYSARSVWPFDYSGDPGPCNWRWVRAPMYNDLGGRLEVWGTDEKKVRKVFGEKKSMFKADKSLSLTVEMTGK